MAYLGLALCAAYTAALLAGPWMIGGRSYTVAALCVILLMCCPFLVQAKLVIVRALAAFFCTELCFKISDYARQHRHAVAGEARFLDFCRFLIPFPPLAVVFGSVERSPQHARPRRAMKLILIGILGTTIGLTGFYQAGGSSLLRDHFAIDHVTKVLLFVTTIESLAATFFGLELVCGFSASRPMRFMIVSRTVAEFWWQYNVRVNQWFYLNAFEPIGGRRFVVRGVFWTFFVSAVLHGWMFAITHRRLSVLLFHVTGSGCASFTVDRTIREARRIDQQARGACIDGRLADRYLHPLLSRLQPSLSVLLHQRTVAAINLFDEPTIQFG